ncbi:MAG: FliG C-terminal domain-containing protein [Sulfurimonadaceae bacterium]
MNTEVLPQHLKSTLLRHSKILLALLFGALALLLYVTSLLSQATALSDIFVDIAIYTIYILLVLLLGSIAFIGYCRFEQEPLIEMNSYTPEGDLLDIENLLEQKEESLFDQDEKMVDDSDYKAMINSSKSRLPSDLTETMRGFGAVESSEIEKIVDYLSQQHPQIAAVILLMIDVKKAETILEHFETAQRDDVVTSMEDTGTISQEALHLLDDALQIELFALQKECSALLQLDSAEIREILRHVDKKELMFALKGAMQELQEKFFVNMSSKASTEFKNVLASVSRIDQKKSQNAIKNLYLIAEQLRDNGKIRATNKAMG